MTYGTTSFEEYPKQQDSVKTLDRIIEIRDRDVVQLKHMSALLSQFTKGSRNLRLTSPDGTVWEISVSNAGALVVTAV